MCGKGCGEAGVPLIGNTPGSRSFFTRELRAERCGVNTTSRSARLGRHCVNRRLPCTALSVLNLLLDDRCVNAVAVTSQ